MPTSTFRREVKTDLARLLIYWREIELSIKRAEQIEKRVVIPAINELRYGARQLFSGITHYNKPRLTPHDELTVRRRLWVAEQYFMNADHDVVDAVVTYIAKIVDTLDLEIGQEQIVMFYADFPALKKQLLTCFDLIADARHDYSLRMANYNTVKNIQLPILIDAVRQIKDAEIRARHAVAERNRDLAKARRVAGIQAWFTYITGAATLLSIPLSIYLWTYAYPDFCKDHGSRLLIRYVCLTPTELKPTP